MTPGKYSMQLQRVADALDDGQVGERILQGAAIRISRAATNKYMQRDTIGARKQSGDGPLRIQTSRLARSLTGAREGTRGRQEGISEITDNTLTYGTRVPYAATHEYGDTRQVTDAMQAFFWAKHKDTGEDRWKAMALSDTLTFPERSFLRPALRDTATSIAELAAEELTRAIQDASDT